MRWYIFETVKGNMAVLLDGNTIYRLILPSPSSPEEIIKAGEYGHIPVSYIKDKEPAPPLLEKIKAYYRGEPITNWEVKAEISSLPPFYRRTLEYISTIPYGTTTTYGEVARALGNPGAARAVGQANKNNPIPLLIPCHRVVGINSPGGFSGPGGVKMKLEMIAMEKSSTVARNLNG